ncbi:MAG: benzene 1,2-dioxygenase, partial [Chloroflexi bacterium]|nr:benzene 1,2-dioxygenase [Chloroflexota bacterium]
MTPTESKPGERASRDLHYEIEQFLFDEARMLDSHDFHAWLDLFTD